MGDVLVNLAEVLEVRDEALSEDEILALFIRAVAPLQALASEAMASHAFDCGFSPETFFLHVDGSIEVKPLHKDGVAPEFLPPEMVDSGDKQNDISQAYVYCLGAVLSYAQRYPNDESDSDEGAKNASPELLSLLNVMTVRDVNTRPTLTRLAQMGRQRAIERKIDPVKMVIDLHHSVMGDEQFDDDEDDDDDDPITGEYSLAVDEAPVRTAPAAAAATPLNASQAVRRKEGEDDDTMSSNRASTPSAAVIGLDIDISEIGSPVGNSTELPAVNADDSLVVHPPDRDSWVSFDGTKLNDSTTTPRKESMLSSSGDEDAKKPTLDPFAYDRLQESLTASGRDPFSSDSNKTTPRRPGPLDGIMPQRRSVDLTSKNHDCVGGARSCHSLECQFCSPTHPQFGATATANKSLPALEMVDGSPPIPAVREKKRKLLATPENLLLGAKTSGDRDPFASFEDLAHPDSSVNDRPPVSRLSSTASSSSASSSGSLKFDSIPPAGSIEALEKGAKRADNIPSSVDPEEPERRGTAGDPAARSAFPIDAQVVIEQPSTRALDDERAASKPTPAPRKTLPAVVERSSSASSVGSDDHFTQDTAPPSVLPTIDQAASRRDQDQQKSQLAPPISPICSPFEGGRNFLLDFLLAVVPSCNVGIVGRDGILFVLWRGAQRRE
uniref:KIND domain-containing protein n=1 Tax=Plectus sambesii TaxID=2011161 RepID=A0A914XK50_9BILA